MSGPEDRQSLFERLASSTRVFEVGGRLPTAALLIWFLQHVKRLDENEAPDAVTDGPGDKGIDGLWVDAVGEEIVVLQAKHRQSLNSTQGDSDLARLVGACAWFSSPEQVDALLAAGPNAELRGLIERHDVRQRVADGFGVRAVFVTNSIFDRSGADYLDAHGGGPPALEGWDLDKLAPYIRYVDRPLYIADEVTLTFAPNASFTVSVGEGIEVTVGALSAKQIADLPGIDDRTLFAQNVRLDLGRTRVNKDIDATLVDEQEHPTFLTFHNGLTMLCREVQRSNGDAVRVKDFSIVNGCQSAVALRRKQASLTDDLLLPVKIVKVGEADKLADEITYRSNNQNAINLKDLRANDSTQVILKGQFEELFGDQVQYVIKRGEETVAPTVIHNDLAAQILIALYNEEPYLAHRKFALFDQNYKRVFHPRIGASHIYLGYLLWEEVQRRLPQIEKELIARYSLTTFVLVHLTGHLMRSTEAGNGILNAPADYIPGQETRVREAVGRLIESIIVDFNGYIREQEADHGYFDYKTRFKSQAAIRELGEDVLRGHQRAVRRDAGYEFSLS